MKGRRARARQIGRRHRSRRRVRFRLLGFRLSVGLFFLRFFLLLFLLFLLRLRCAVLLARFVRVRRSRSLGMCRNGPRRRCRILSKIDPMRLVRHPLMLVVISLPSSLACDCKPTSKALHSARVPSLLFGVRPSRRPGSHTRCDPYEYYGTPGMSRHPCKNH